MVCLPHWKEKSVIKQYMNTTITAHNSLSTEVSTTLIITGVKRKSLNRFKSMHEKYAKQVYMVGLQAYANRCGYVTARCKCMLWERKASGNGMFSRNGFRVTKKMRTHAHAHIMDFNIIPC